MSKSKKITWKISSDINSSVQFLSKLHFEITNVCTEELIYMDSYLHPMAMLIHNQFEYQSFYFFT